MTDNPLLPPEIFTTSSAVDSDKTNKNKPIRVNRIDSLVTMHPFAIGLKQAEKALSSLEENILIGQYGRTIRTESKATASKAELSAYESYDTLQKKLAAKRIVRLIKTFIDSEVAVPRSIRFHMRPGYLRGIYTALSFASSIKREKNTINTREVLHEPWWAMALIADIYLLKCQYDAKAFSAGCGTIPLSQAVVSYFYIRTGSIEITERLTHDLMYCVKSYKWEVSRLRLFSALIGETSTDLDEISSYALKSPQAWGVYISLLQHIREEVHHATKNRTSKGNSVAISDDKNPHDPNGLIVHETYKSPYTTKTLSHMITNHLFISSENCLNRQDGKDLWTENIDLIIRAVGRWAKTQKCLNEDNESLFMDILLQLTVKNHQDMNLKSQSNIFMNLHMGDGSVISPPVSPSKRAALQFTSMKDVEVDDVLWVVMLQWAKLMSWYATRGRSRIAWLDKELAKKLNETSYHNTNQTQDIRPQHQYSYDTLTNILESAYGPSMDYHAKYSGSSVSNLNALMSQPSLSQSSTQDNHPTADSQHYLSRYMSHMSQNGNKPGLPSYFLTDVILWDLNVPRHVKDNKHTIVNSSNDGGSLEFAVSPVFDIIIAKRLLDSYWIGLKQFLVEVSNPFA